MKAFTIGQVASQIGISRDAIRIYEKKGLLEKPLRSANGYRRYPETVLTRLRFIQKAKEAGFRLREIKELLAIRITSSFTCNEINKITQRKLEEIKGKIRQLKIIQKTLETLLKTCQTTPEEECSILHAFETNGGAKYQR